MRPRRAKISPLTATTATTARLLGKAAANHRSSKITLFLFARVEVHKTGANTHKPQSPRDFRLSFPYRVEQATNR